MERLLISCFETVYSTYLPYLARIQQKKKKPQLFSAVRNALAEIEIATTLSSALNGIKFLGLNNCEQRLVPEKLNKLKKKHFRK